MNSQKWQVTIVLKSGTILKLKDIFDTLLQAGEYAETKAEFLRNICSAKIEHIQYCSAEA